MFYKFICIIFLLACFPCFVVSDDLINSSNVVQQISKTITDNSTAKVEEDLTEICNQSQPCSNGGSCLKYHCVCLPGTYGNFCENVFDCLHTDLCKTDAYTRCAYDIGRQKAYCNCNAQYRFDEASKMCRSCLCTDWYAQNLHSWSYCEYQQGQQICVCTEGYSYNPREKICKYCDCSPNSTWCAFDTNGDKLCGCVPGYFYNGNGCDKCLCGSHGICDPNVLFPYCACDEGYVEHKGLCTECSCGKYGRCLYDQNNKQFGCKCDSGYSEKAGKCAMCYCGDNVNCTFTDDEKVCSCEPGYEDVNGFCNDINECEKHNPCKESMTCVNMPGSYTCICKEGYKPVIIDNIIKIIEICQDIDECQNSSVCEQPNTFCENTNGGYKCICKSGFVSRGMAGSSQLCDESTAKSIYTLIGIASFASLIIFGGVVYYVKKTFRKYPAYKHEMK